MKIEKILTQSDSISLVNNYMNDCTIVPSEKMIDFIESRFQTDLIKSKLFASNTFNFLIEVNAPESLTGLSDNKNRTIQKWILWETIENPKTSEPSFMFAYYNFFMKRIHFEKNFLLDQIAFLTIIESKLESDPKLFNERTVSRINGFNFRF
jgi:hypothetical protein